MDAGPIDVDVGSCLFFEIKWVPPGRSREEMVAFHMGKAIVRLVDAVMAAHFAGADAGARVELHDGLCSVFNRLLAVNAKDSLAADVRRQVKTRRAKLLESPATRRHALQRLEEYASDMATTQTEVMDDFFNPALSMFQSTIDCLTVRAAKDPMQHEAYPKQQEDLQRLVDKMQNPEARYALFLEPNSRRVPRFKLFLQERHRTPKEEKKAGKPDAVGQEVRQQYTYPEVREVVGEDAAGELDAMEAEGMLPVLRRWLASVCEQDQPPSVTALALLAREAANMLAGTAQHFPFQQSIVEREWNFTPEVHAAAKSSMDTVTDLLELLCAYEAAGVAPHPALALAVSDAVAAHDIIDHDVYADSLTLLDKALASAVGMMTRKMGEMEAEIATVKGSHVELSERTGRLEGDAASAKAQLDDMTQQLAFWKQLAEATEQRVERMADMQVSSLKMVVGALTNMGARDKTMNKFLKAMKSLCADAGCAFAADERRPPARSAMSNMASLENLVPNEEEDIAAATDGMASMSLSSAPEAAVPAARAAEQRIPAPRVPRGAASGAQLRGSQPAGAPTVGAAAPGRLRQPVGAAEAADAHIQPARPPPASQAPRSSSHSGTASPPAAGPLRRPTTQPGARPTTQPGARPSALPAPVDARRGPTGPNASSQPAAANPADGTTAGTGGPSRRRAANASGPQANSRRGH